MRLSHAWSVRFISFLLKKDKPIPKAIMNFCLRGHFQIPNFLAGWITSIVVSVLTIASALIPSSPGMVTLMGFTVPQMSDKFAMIFNFTVTLFLSAFNKMASWQLSSWCQKPFSKVVEATNKQGLTQNIYIPMALDSAAHVAAVIASSIEAGGHKDGSDGKILRDKDGIYDTSRSISAILKEESYIEALNESLESISRAFFKIKKWPNDDERILQTLFLSILKETVQPLMKKTGALALIDGEPINYPVVFAEKIWWKALAAARGSESPAATCLMSFANFYSVYAHRLTEENTNGWTKNTKPRRIFILPNDQWQKFLLEELVDLMFENPINVDLPAAPKDNEVGGWKKGAKISHFAWVVEFHNALGWDVRFLDRGKAEKELRAGPGTLKHIDFLIVPIGERQLLFSADIDNVDIDQKELCGLPVRLCPIKVSFGIENYTTFYDRLWTIANPASKLLREQFPDHHAFDTLIPALET
jgi:hypothetical protein